MRKNYYVTKTEKGWETKLEDKNRPIFTGKTKSEVVRETIAHAKKDRMASVKIFKADGLIQEERTYPRSTDPERFKG